MITLWRLEIVQNLKIAGKVRIISRDGDEVKTIWETENYSLEECPDAIRFCEIYTMYADEDYIVIGI